MRHKKLGRDILISILIWVVAMQLFVFFRFFGLDVRSPFDPNLPVDRSFIATAAAITGILLGIIYPFI